jgi:hypothetical protein
LPSSFWEVALVGGFPFLFLLAYFLFRWLHPDNLRVTPYQCAYQTIGAESVSVLLNPSSPRLSHLFHSCANRFIFHRAFLSGLDIIMYQILCQGCTIYLIHQINGGNNNVHRPCHWWNAQHNPISHLLRAAPAHHRRHRMGYQKQKARTITVRAFFILHPSSFILSPSSFPLHSHTHQSPVLAFLRLQLLPRVQGQGRKDHQDGIRLA